MTFLTTKKFFVSGILKEKNLFFFQNSLHVLSVEFSINFFEEETKEEVEAKRKTIKQTYLKAFILNYSSFQKKLK